MGYPDQTKEELDTPALWVDLDALEHNIAHLSETFRTAGVGWRPHFKGIKVPAIAHMALAAGALGVTCAKLGEAEVLAAAGIRDILIANQVVTPRKIARLIHLQRYADAIVAVDSGPNTAALGAAAQAKGVDLGVVVELDLGMHRAGVDPGPPALELARQVHTTPGLRLRGLMGWEGHARALVDLEARRRVIEAAIEQLVRSAEQCRAAGLPVDIVSAGGTGTYYVTAYHPAVTEIQAGGAIFGDVAARDWGVDTQPALFVRATVTSRPTPERIIIDAGFKALPAWHAAPEPMNLPGVQVHRASAEHGSLTLGEANTTHHVGDAIDFRVGYGDETVCLYDELYGIRRDVVEVVWPILARGKIR
jgi:D-serine deaminase-like pyridoxal phosphate-dependent protein